MHHMLLVKLDSSRNLNTRNLTLLHLGEITAFGWVLLTIFLGPIGVLISKLYVELLVMSFGQLLLHLLRFNDLHCLLVLNLYCHLYYQLMRNNSLAPLLRMHLIQIEG